MGGTTVSVVCAEIHTTASVNTVCKRAGVKTLIFPQSRASLRDCAVLFISLVRGTTAQRKRTVITFSAFL